MEGGTPKGYFQLGVVFGAGTELQIKTSLQDILDKLDKDAKENGDKDDKGDKGDKDNKDDKDDKDNKDAGEDEAASIGDSPSNLNEDYSSYNPDDIFLAALQSIISGTQQGEEKIAEIANKAPKDVAAAIKNNADAVKAFWKKAREYAYAFLKNYMTTFAGQQQADRILLEDV